jgi:hypothetical protein
MQAYCFLLRFHYADVLQKEILKILDFINGIVYIWLQIVLSLFYLIFFYYQINHLAARCWEIIKVKI